ncbi:hypothetical protein B0H14DRAFT_3861641, partial [Mycena olivaceomarginata]
MIPSSAPQATARLRMSAPASSTEPLHLPPSWCPRYASAPPARMRRGAERPRIRIRRGGRSDYGQGRTQGKRSSSTRMRRVRQRTRAWVGLELVGLEGALILVRVPGVAWQWARWEPEREDHRLRGVLATPPLHPHEYDAVPSSSPFASSIAHDANAQQRSSSTRTWCIRQCMKVWLGLGLVDFEGAFVVVWEPGVAGEWARWEPEGGECKARKTRAA